MNNSVALTPTDWSSDAMQRRLKKRYASERRFRFLGLFAIVLSASFLAFLLFTMAANGFRGFTQVRVDVPVDFPGLALPLDARAIQQSGGAYGLAGVDFDDAATRAVEAAYGPGTGAALAENAGEVLRDKVAADPSILAKRVDLSLPASPGITVAASGDGDPASVTLYEALKAKAAVSRAFNTGFLTESDATDPTQVGIWGAFKGSLLTMLVTLLLAFPIGVLSAIYLEEYAPKNRWTDLIEVSINNLAAVPSIIFGLLGLAVFLNTMNLPRSAPLVGGLTLALMTMPVIVIAGRNAIKAVPPSIRDAALGVGASPIQVVFHHVLPLALPGILTGTIIGMARALGETAPLLMIGMRAFVATPPGGITDPSSVLPVQIFLWSDEISRAFIEKTSAAIIVLLVFLLAMNGLAIYLRNRFETRW